jgi:hypothetical protein
MNRQSDDAESDEQVAQLEAAARELGLTVSVLGEIDTAAVALLLGCARHTLENQRTLGTGPTFVRRGGRVRYRIRDLADWMLRG